MIAAHAPTSEPAGRRSAFTLLEVIVVVLIIGIISAIAVPRISEAARMSKVTALKSDLAVIRHSVQRYRIDHGRYPGYDPTTGNPDSSWFIDQLTLYTDAAGNTSAAPSNQHVYGPYLPRPFPTNPINDRSTVYVKEQPDDADPAADYGWVIVLSNGSFGVRSSLTEISDYGVRDTNVAKNLKGITTADLAAEVAP